ncbi:hypothetical protein SCHPADRAFT_939994 [Schizopora paradoxa]|uniref:Uncharacterized protein n=1 Tax=Schizopora paradoxa TaxID=27342 RepID=A0A0H2RPR7_9AGAM|nr:hypothetical protein SCHPADRAFT_939994 [Schizopora paradoxa]
MSEFEKGDDTQAVLATLQRIELLLEQTVKVKDSEDAKILELASVNIVFCVFIASIDVALLAYLETVIAARDDHTLQTNDIVAMTFWFISIGLSINLAQTSFLTQKVGVQSRAGDDALLCKSSLYFFKKPCCKWADPCASHRQELGIPLDEELDPRTREPMPLGTLYLHPEGTIGDKSRLSFESHRLMLRGGAEKSWITIMISVWLLLFGVGVLVGSEFPRPAAVLFIISAFLAPNLISESVFPYVAVLVDWILLAVITVINWGWAMFDLVSNRRSKPRYTAPSFNQHGTV